MDTDQREGGEQPRTRRAVVLVCPSPTTTGCEGGITVWASGASGTCACGRPLVSR